MERIFLDLHFGDLKGERNEWTAPPRKKNGRIMGCWKVQDQRELSSNEDNWEIEE